jgi:hypothetical protein
MENFDKIEQKVEEALKSLKGIIAAEPKPFFYTRLHTRMEQELLQPKTILGFQLKPIYAYSVIIVLIGFNAFAISNFKNHNTSTSQQEYCSLYEVE